MDDHARNRKTSWWERRSQCIYIGHAWLTSCEKFCERTHRSLDKKSPHTFSFSHIEIKQLILRHFRDTGFFSKRARNRFSIQTILCRKETVIVFCSAKIQERLVLIVVSFSWKQDSRFRFNFLGSLLFPFSTPKIYPEEYISKQSSFTFLSQIYSCDTHCDTHCDTDLPSFSRVETICWTSSLSCLLSVTELISRRYQRKTWHHRFNSSALEKKEQKETWTKMPEWVGDLSRRMNKKKTREDKQWKELQNEGGAVVWKKQKDMKTWSSCLEHRKCICCFCKIGWESILICRWCYLTPHMQGGEEKEEKGERDQQMQVTS